MKNPSAEWILFRAMEILDMSNWTKLSETIYADFHRTGWLGVYDAFKAVITRNNRLIVTKPVTFSVYVNYVNGAAYLSGAQLEIDNEN